MLKIRTGYCRIIGITAINIALQSNHSQGSNITSAGESGNRCDVDHRTSSLLPTRDYVSPITSQLPVPGCRGGTE